MTSILAKLKAKVANALEALLMKWTMPLSEPASMMLSGSMSGKVSPIRRELH